MSDNRRFTIGILIGDANSAHSLNTLQGIRQAAKEIGVNTVVFLGVHTEYMFRNFYREEASYDYQVMTVFDYVDIAKVDALLISYSEVGIYLSDNKRSVFFERFKNVPKIVLEDRYEDENSRYQISGNYAGMRAIVEHLVNDHGYRRFAELRGPIGNTDAEERHRAFLDVMQEHGIEVTDEMVQVGNWTEMVEQEVEYLLDHNPNLEALVCANDVMAGCVYKICKQRRNEILKNTERAREWLKRSPQKYKIGTKIEHGEGLAVTGYDDHADAGIMDPPLTTAKQNEFENGYRAIYNLIDLLCTGQGENIEQYAEFICRYSCGCRDAEQHHYEPMSAHERQNPEIYVIRLAEQIRDSIIISDVNEGIADKIYDLVYDILYADIVIYLGYAKAKLRPKQVIEQLRSLLTGPYAEYILPTALVRTFSDFLSEMIRKTVNHSDEVLLTEIMVEGMKYMQNFVYKSATDSLSAFENAAWFMSMISRDMVNHVHSEREMYLNAMRKMQNLNLGSTYIFTLREPMIVHGEDEWKCPERLYLSASCTDTGEAVAYEWKDRPVMTKELGFEKFTGKEDGTAFHIVITPLYSDLTQYGLLVSEAQPANVITMFNASVQIGTALKYNELSRRQQKAQASLESMIREVEEKNSMLRFISEYDSLTGCLNRRGFIEKAVELKNENVGKRALVVFGDLDHLKEINDRFGHGEGDFAIKTQAELIRRAVGENAIFSRLGGDEFVAMLLSEEDLAARIAAAIKAEAAAFNDRSEKPYYVECSVGFKEFICEKDLSIQSILEEADKQLYISKRQRRPSILK